MPVPALPSARRAGRTLGHLWALPNTLVGALFGLGGQWRWDPGAEAFIVIGGWMAAIFRRLGYAGMSIGDVVLCAYDLPVRSPDVYRHELVHTVQARLLGPLYLPLTLLGYAFGLLRFPANPHDGSPLEVWADAASGNAARNAYLCHRHSREQGQPGRLG